LAGESAYRVTVTTLTRRANSGALGYRLALWPPRAWSKVPYICAAIPAQLAGLLVPVILGYWTRRWALSRWPLLAGQPLHAPAELDRAPGGVLFGAGALILMWLVEAAAVFLAVPALTQMHRHRVQVTAGVDIPALPAIPARLSALGISAAARSRATWRQLGYHLIAGPALAASGVAVLGAWLAGVLYALVYCYAWALPHRSLLWRGQSPGGQTNHLPSMLGIPADAYLTGAGILLLCVAPWLTRAVAAWDAITARALLGPSRTEELENQVQRLAQTRAGAVDAADAERRRLERDLHDGTQQRLVALAMNLGMAKAKATSAEQARHAIAEAHEEAKAALTELRNLIRGLHPAVLDDRGLDAALSGVIARMPVPVRLTVDLDRRPAPVIEAVAYFVVSEALTNVAKHAQASQAQVLVQRAGDRLHVIISDDGVGGADPARGTGLAGLAKRASSVDGNFEIASPPGGPTLITVDLPCAR
jgi:signal transduction histidine kinase